MFFRLNETKAVLEKIADICINEQWVSCEIHKRLQEAVKCMTISLIINQVISHCLLKNLQIKVKAFNAVEIRQMR